MISQRKGREGERVLCSRPKFHSGKNYGHREVATFIFRAKKQNKSCLHSEEMKCKMKYLITIIMFEKTDSLIWQRRGGGRCVTL